MNQTRPTTENRSTEIRSTEIRRAEDAAYGRVLQIPAAARDAGLLVARVLLGVIMMAHGWQKLVTNGLEKQGKGFAAMGVPMPELSAGFAGTVELVGGALLVLGLATPLVALLNVLVLAGAWWFAHRDGGIFVTNKGWELVAALGLASAVFGLVGPGRFSLDALIARRRTRAAAVAEERESELVEAR